MSAAPLSMPSPLEPTLPALDDTLGVVMIGAFICAIWYGIICLQSFMVLHKLCKDDVYTKCTVWVLWVVNTAHLALSIHPCYWYMVTNYGRPTTIYRITWSISFGVVLTGLNDAIVRSWFIYRVWILSERNRPLTAALATCIAFAFAMTMVVAGQSYRAMTFPAFRESSKWVLQADMASVFVSDVVLALLLCYYLARTRNKVFSRRIGSYINALLVYTVNTGLLTSMVAMGCLITFVRLQHNFVFVAFYFPMASIYANSLLASFNIRDFFGNRQEPESFALPLSRLSSAPCSQRATRVGQPKPTGLHDAADTGR
ncbi:hypothetical protein PsYK624_098100 [Phanerochaete sordida]|uniref:DUF6534 domain-containing protein n=1 Tax=Phanerochaete sordida TaxID=48140 RepID=A0A9P3GF25_9APHY|nr:hypothetical protein PsYK624_098100 [Phanerochaete sordida]